MSEIATWSMIRSKIPSFPAPTSGRDNECLTKSEILAKGGENVRVEGSYGNGECVMLDNVLANVITWEYTFSVTPTSLSFDAIGGTRQVSVTSYKRKYLNGSYTGQQVDVGFSSSASGTGFSSVGASVSANENTAATTRSGSAKFTQSESGKTVSIAIAQAIYVTPIQTTMVMYRNEASVIQLSGTVSEITIDKYTFTGVNVPVLCTLNNDQTSQSAGGFTFTFKGNSLEVIISKTFPKIKIVLFIIIQGKSYGISIEVK